MEKMMTKKNKKRLRDIGLLFKDSELRPSCDSMITKSKIRATTISNLIFPRNGKYTPGLVIEIHRYASNP